MDTVYCEFANGGLEYWTYSDGKRHYLDRKTVYKWVRAKTATVTRV